jgi:hypothetical protein
MPEKKALRFIRTKACLDVFFMEKLRTKDGPTQKGMPCIVGSFI